MTSDSRTTKRLCPSGGRCPSPGCRFYAHERPMPPSLAWCLCDLPRGVELTQREAAASLGITERQLRRAEIKLRAKLAALPAARELAREFGFLPVATGACAPNVRLPDAIVQNGARALPRMFPDFASRAQAWSSVPMVPPSRAPFSSASAAVRATHLSPRKASHSMKTTTTATAMTVTTTPDQLVAELEALPPGDRGADVLLAEVNAAITAALAAPRERLFPPDLVRVGAEIYAAYGHHVSRLTAPGFWKQVLELYRRAKRSMPELCGLLRSAEMLADVGNAAAQLATPENMYQTAQEAGDRAAADARSRFERGVAEIEAGAAGEMAAPAREVLAMLALADRAAAAMERHRKAAQLAAERAEAERRAAETAAAEAALAAAVERELADEMVRRGLPQDLATCPERSQVELLARARARLRASPAMSIRVGGRLYDARQTASAIGRDTTELQLGVYLAALDIAEAELARDSAS